MLAAPAQWFHTIPGVADTGPLNYHLVRDVGCAYLVAAAGLGWRALRGNIASPAAMLAALFLGLHAGVHLWEVAVGICGISRFVQDIPGVVLPAILVGWLGRPTTTEAAHA